MERQIPAGLGNININSKIIKVKRLLEKNLYKHIF